MLTVNDVMNTEVVTTRPDTSVGQVIDLLLEEDVSSLPVVDENNRLIGLVTESVLLVASVDPQLQTDPISLHMERKFVSAGPNEPVGQVLEKFLLHRVRHFPVVENKRLLGVITRRQLMRALLGRDISQRLAQS